MSDKLLVPDIGDFEKVEVIEILVKKGDKIKKNDPVVTIESDKSSVEVPSSIEGIVETVNVKIGDKVSKDDLLITLNGDIGLKKTDEKAKENKQQKFEENIPPLTKKIIEQAEKSISPQEKDIIKNNETEKKIHEENSNKNQKIEIVGHGDIDPVETKEWLESLSAVLENDGKERAQFLIKKLIDHSYKEGSDLVLSRNTPYVNTITPDEEIKSPGDQNIERKIRSLIRWNAAAMVVRANKKNPELGGHIGTFASAATLYDIGMNHFWRAKNNKYGGDLIYFQGHSAPGMYVCKSFFRGKNF